jgi:hypothetical protein
VVTIDPGAGTATLPPILAALIAYDLQAAGNGVLTINPDDPPGGQAHSRLSAGGAATDVHSAALAALTGGGLGHPGELTDQEAMDAVAMSLAGNADPGNQYWSQTKKRS